VPATIQALTDHPDWNSTDFFLAKSDLDRIDRRAAASDRTLCCARACRFLQVYGSTETCPVAIYTRLGGDLFAPSAQPASLVCAAKRR